MGASAEPGDTELAHRLQMMSIEDMRVLSSLLGTDAGPRAGRKRAAPGVPEAPHVDLAAAIAEEVRSLRTLRRTIDDVPDTVQFSDVDTFYRLENALSSYNCHHGQRKLFFTMLEFLTLCAQRLPLGDALVVYVGAAPGYNMRMIAELFPCAMYLLIDPAPFDIKESHNLRIWHRMFTDHTVPDIRAYQAIVNRQHLLFVSDMRMSPREEDVGRDMSSQQRWGVQLAAAAMMLKFRLPYFGTPASAQLSADSECGIDAIQEHVDMPPPDSKPAHSYLYLDGLVLPQLYAPLRSAETRLVVFHPHVATPLGRKRYVRYPPAVAVSGRCKYAVRFWDYRSYEAKMNAYNIVGRSLLNYTSSECGDDSSRLGDHLLGYGSDYESVAEYQLACEYLRCHRLCVSYNGRYGGCAGAARKNDWSSAAYNSLTLGIVNQRPTRTQLAEPGLAEPTLEHVVIFLHRVNMRLVHHYSSKVSLVLCAIKTIASHIRKYNELDSAEREQQIKRVSTVVLDRFRRQLKVVAMGTILSAREKQDMIDCVARDVEALSSTKSTEYY